MSTIDYLAQSVIPAASSLLPVAMTSTQATAMLLAIALQESKAAARRQGGEGPARGFWQFEVSGVAGVRLHHATQEYVRDVLETLCYAPKSTHRALQLALTDNDVLACVFARLNLWWLPAPLPGPDHQAEGWRQYLEAWRPGKPHPETWPEHFAQAWALVNRTDP